MRKLKSIRKNGDSLKKKKGDRRLKCGTACKKEKVTKEMQESLRKEIVRVLLLRQSPRSENRTENLCGEAVTTLCLVKEAAPAPGGLDAEARQRADEAKSLASVASDIARGILNPRFNCLTHAFHSD